MLANKRWRVGYIAGLVLLSGLAFAQPARADDDSCKKGKCPGACAPCPAGSTCSSCDTKRCGGKKRRPATIVVRSCCKNQTTKKITCQKCPKCPPVSPSGDDDDDD